MNQNYIFKRGDWYIFRRRIPKFIKHLDDRKEIKISLKTKNTKEAMIRASIYNDHIENFWKSLVKSTPSENMMQKYKVAVRLAKSHGFAYKTAEQVAASALDEIVERLPYNIHKEPHTSALLGGTEQPSIKLSDCEELYWPLISDKLVNKSEYQIRKWENPRKLAIRNFIEVLGDKPLHLINRSDVLTFRRWWSQRITEGLTANSANKQLLYVRDILQTVALHHELDNDFEPLFAKTSFKNNKQSRRPFEASYVQNTLLPSLGGLSDRDRMVLWAMADTGARIREIFGLAPEDIILNENIPFIWIRPRDKYSLKTVTSERKIPLVGTALSAFKTFPKGFEHLGHPDTFSNIVNGYMKNKGLKPSDRHSAYSLRHTFKDRLRDAEAPEEIIDELMGHRKKGPHYGRGHKLENKHKWLEKIAYKTSL